MTFDAHVSVMPYRRNKTTNIACQAEVFYPIHEYRHLVWHSKLAESCGLLPEHIVVMESGDILEVSEDGAQVAGHIDAEYVYLDGNGMGNANPQVIADRRILASEGFVVVSVNIDKYTGGLVGQLQVITRGVVSPDDSESLAALIRETALSSSPWYAHWCAGLFNANAWFTTR